MCIPPHEDKGGILEEWHHRGMRNTMSSGGDGVEIPDTLTQLTEVCNDVTGHRRSGDEITRDRDGGTVHELGRGAVQILFGGSTNPQKNPRKLVRPIRTMEASLESLFEVTVESLHQPVGLMVVGGCGRDRRA